MLSLGPGRSVKISHGLHLFFEYLSKSHGSDVQSAGIERLSSTATLVGTPQDHLSGMGKRCAAEGMMAHCSLLFDRDFPNSNPPCL